MSKNNFYFMAIVLVLVGLTSACTLRRAETPTPFSYPTPDLTMTALFAPAQEVPATSAEITDAPANTSVPQSSPLPTSTLTFTPSPTLTQIPPTATPYPTYTPYPSQTPIPTAITYDGPGVRPGAGVIAAYFGAAPTMDGDLSEWSETQYPIANIAYGAGNHSSAADLSGTVMLGWDADNLYLAVEVFDDVYVQEATGQNIFKGDSIEVLIDLNVSGDYYWAELSGDDYQVGVSPGNPTVGNSPEAYLWYPWNVAGSRPQVQIGATSTAQGYLIEAALPWTMFGVSPASGNHYGFGFSLSDNDSAGTTIQQSMVSNLANRVFTNPMTWGDLLLGP